jgi:ATP-dependent protease ClpP protease subunit
MPTTKKITRLSANWARSIHVNKIIDDETVRQLAPLILQLRQEDKGPITIGIDSPGGSMSSLEAIQSLLNGPTEKSAHEIFITVVTRRAFSAAAILLASGDYSIAMKHSEILFHDLRYPNLDDVTPDTARDAAKKLQNANADAALKLARVVIRRLVYGYVAQFNEFELARTQVPRIHAAFSKCIYLESEKTQEPKIFELALYATRIHQKLSENNKDLMEKIMERMASQKHMSHISMLIGRMTRKAKDKSGGIGFIHDLIGEKENKKQIESELRLFMTILGSKIKTSDFAGQPLELQIEMALREYSMLQAINNSQLIEDAVQKLSEFGILFKFRAKNEAELSASEKRKITLKINSSMRLLWLFCIVLCRELLSGEWMLTPTDAQLLGLVDEVYGGGAFQSIAERLREGNSGKRKSR